MTKVLLSVHIVAAILVVGSITVAASLFPRYAKQAVLGGEAAGGGRAAGVAVFLHRICGAYAVAGVTVPVFGIATASELGVLTDAWLITSLVLTVIAAAILALTILPGQRRMLALTGEGDAEEGAAGEGTAEEGTVAKEKRVTEAGLSAVAARLAMSTGVFNILWTVVVVLMIFRPGSTTGG
ncbi:hypothetical protein [Streptomyces sp. XD-27]|uniref:hypothetical protein n=1 Tax=Streptomyces sp. XD-27 TaxID=3062779 RepID=UPI0026F43960|nr:hypothetical protein [Streptomyces sp. XD-27]WKX71865.1 hypothetical protein Q3Y56_19945 [Streptomyces sp. XD-27]